MRQGDPLSPALYIIAVKYLSRGLTSLFSRNLTLYFRNLSETYISHLCFADDIIVFSNASINMVRLLCDFLNNFELESGLSINKLKSSFVPAKKISKGKFQVIVNTSNFVSQALPLNYLGAPLFKRKKKNFSLIKFLGASKRN